MSATAEIACVPRHVAVIMDGNGRWAKSHGFERFFGHRHGTRATIETVAGLLHAEPDGADITVDMGAPRFDWEGIPLAYPVDTRDMPVAWGPLERPAAVNMGNPHVVFFVPDAAAIALDSLGQMAAHALKTARKLYHFQARSHRLDGHVQLPVVERLQSLGQQLQWPAHPTRSQPAHAHQHRQAKY